MDEKSSDHSKKRADAADVSASPLDEAAASLSYEAGRDRVLRSAGRSLDEKVGVMILAVFLAAGAIVFAGVIAFDAAGMPLEGRMDPVTLRRAHIVGGVFGAGFMAWMVGLFFLWRKPWVSTYSRWFVLGLLIGLGLMSLIEGACFIWGN